MKQEMMTTEFILSRLPERLLPWYRLHARELPWRETTDPYRIWVSEIMLQQTRVAAVLGYYARFLEAFPSVEALAAAPEERLMKLWEGLGYYSRARNLQKAARQIVAQGGFPQSYAGLLALPGVGAYTAGAIASAAFGLREAAVDGNVLRVYARLTDCHEDVLSPAMKRTVEQSLRAVMPACEADIRVFNQAIMELGATVCAPNGPPRCEACPMGELCRARQQGTAEALPVKRAKKARRTEEMTVFVLIQDGKVALRRRVNSGLLAGLWEFPHVSGLLNELQAPEILREWGLEAVDWKRFLTAKHIFTHVEWHMSGYVLQVRGTGPAELLWVDGAGLAEHAVPSAFVRYYEEARDWLSE